MWVGVCVRACVRACVWVYLFHIFLGVWFLGFGFSSCELDVRSAYMFVVM